MCEKSLREKLTQFPIEKEEDEERDGDRNNWREREKRFEKQVNKSPQQTQRR